MRALLDINVLLALLDPAHVHHSQARAWFVENRAHGWASCPITQNGFLRIVSGRGYPNPVPLADAADALRAQLALPGHEFWIDDISVLDERLFAQDRFLNPRHLTDIYLLALAVRNRGRLVTFDRRVMRGAVHSADPGHLVLLG